MDVENARALAEEGLAILQRVGTPEDVALAFNTLCQLEAWTHNLTALQHNAEQMARIANEIADDWMLAVSLFPLSNVAAHVADLDEAAKLAQRFADHAQACGDSDLRLMSLLVVQVKIAKRRGDYAEVQRVCTQGLELAEAIHSVYNIAFAHAELGHAALHLHEFPQAAAHFHQVLQFEVGFGSRFSLLHSVFSVAQLWVALGKMAQAVSLITLVCETGGTMREIRLQAEAALAELRAQLSPQAFAAAQERGRRTEIGTLAQELLAALSALAQAPASARISPHEQQAADHLTARELQILRLVADGLTNGEIASELFLATSTVKWYVRGIFRKLYATSRTQVVMHARNLGLLP
jgi:DNA-binding NarL/FixJ family response regulator